MRILDVQHIISSPPATGQDQDVLQQRLSEGVVKALENLRDPAGDPAAEGKGMHAEESFVLSLAMALRNRVPVLKVEDKHRETVWRCGLGVNLARCLPM